jgi:hypothetical protein
MQLEPQMQWIKFVYSNFLGLPNYGDINFQIEVALLSSSILVVPTKVFPSHVQRLFIYIFNKNLLRSFLLFGQGAPCV